MPTLARRPLRDIFEQASSTAPTPGGGSVTALCGMLGIGLILKALRISIRRLDDPSVHADGDARLAALADALAEDAEADERAFQAYIDAARLPKESDADRRVRDKALGGAAIAAAEAALRTLGHAKDAYAVSRVLEPAIKPSIHADLVAGRELLKVVRTVAVENVEANLRGLRDEIARQRLAQALARDGAADAFS